MSAREQRNADLRAANAASQLNIATTIMGVGNPNATHTVLIRHRNGDTSIAVFGERQTALAFAASRMDVDALAYRAERGVFFEGRTTTIHVVETPLGSGKVTRI